MNVVEKIMQDEETLILFLDYMKCYLLQKELPVSLPEGASEQETTDYLKQVWTFNKSVEELTTVLEKKYMLPKDFEADGSKMNTTIKHVCALLLEKYGESYIRNRSVDYKSNTEKT